jgi:hypothetical protein
MDTIEEAWHLLENLKAHQTAAFNAQRLAMALRLDDIMRHPGEVTFVTDVLQHVIDLIIPIESDADVRNALFDAVANAMSRNLSVDVSLDGLLPYCTDDDPALVSNVLILIAKSGHPKYAPVVERYRAHANDIIRNNAEHAWKWVYRN